MGTRPGQHEDRLKAGGFDLLLPADVVRLTSLLREVVRACEAALVSLDSTRPMQEPDSIAGLRHPLTDTEANILEALGTEALRGEKLGRRTGYPYNSNFRNVLSNLVKRDLLGKGPKGYYRLPVCHDTEPRNVRAV